MQTVALDLITRSMRLIGVLASEETPTAAEANDALAVLNDILDGWALENLALYRNEPDVFDLVAGQQEYTIGPGGDFDHERPVDLEAAYVVFSGLDFKLRILSTDEWNAIVMKDFAVPIPSAIYYLSEHPLGKLQIWPKPSQAIKLKLTTNMQFSKLASVSESISLPPGYLKLALYTLAVELAPYFGIQAPPTVISIAKATMGNVKATNAEPQESDFDPALVGGGRSGLAGFIGGY